MRIYLPFDIELVKQIVAPSGSFFVAAADVFIFSVLSLQTHTPSPEFHHFLNSFLTAIPIFSNV